MGRLDDLRAQREAKYRKIDILAPMDEEPVDHPAYLEDLKKSFIEKKPVHTTVGPTSTPVGPTLCPVCEARKAAKAKSQAKRRAKLKAKTP